MHVRGRLAFARAEHLVPDEVSSRALLRAPTREFSRMPTPDSFDEVECELTDLRASDHTPTLAEDGFAIASLSRVAGLADVLAAIHRVGEITDHDRPTLRRILRGRALGLSGGRTARILHVASEGILLRRSGPDGLAVPGATEIPAASVHVDQDVDGTPVKQILFGLAPRLFHHDSPLHKNDWSRLYVLNLWIGLQQITAPLALASRQGLDRRREQVRYGLPTDAFLQRSTDRAVNDIYLMRPGPGQRWYFSSEMEPNTGYVFETMSTPHGSFVLPGEAEAKALLLGARRVAAGEPAGPLPEHAPSTTRPLREAIDALRELVLAGERDGPSPCWRERLAELEHRLTRTSLELRIVAWV